MKSNNLLSTGTQHNLPPQGNRKSLLKQGQSPPLLEGRAPLDVRRLVVLLPRSCRAFSTDRKKKKKVIIVFNGLESGKKEQKKGDYTWIFFRPGPSSVIGGWRPDRTGQTVEI